MYKGIFTDSDLLYRIDVVNSIDFYAMGFDMMRGETYARNALQWPQQERTDVLIVNVRLEDMSGFELAERIRRQMPQVKVIFLADSPDGADAQAAVRFGAFDYVLKSDGIDALRAALSRAAEELHAESREEAYLRSQTNWDEIIPKLLRLLTALRPEICEEHWQLYSRIKPLVSNDSFCIETLLVRALMEELRMEIRRRDEALFLQIRSSIMDTPLGGTDIHTRCGNANRHNLEAARGKGLYYAGGCAEKRHHWARLCLYADAPWRKADCRERSGVCPYQLTALCPKVPRGDE